MFEFLGEGQFGIIFRGCLQNYDKSGPVECAVKKLKKNSDEIVGVRMGKEKKVNKR